MLDNTALILSYYVENISRYDIHSVEMFRVDVEDIVYIVNSKSGSFALFETDYIFSQDDAVTTLREIATEQGYKFLSVESIKNSPAEDIVYTTENGRYKYIVSSIKDLSEKNYPSSPLAYGG